VQVAGRAGVRKTRKVIMQTRQPEHPLLTTLIRKGYRSFAKTALAERKEALLPPFSYQALLRVQAGDVDTPQLFFRRSPLCYRNTIKVIPRFWPGVCTNGEACRSLPLSIAVSKHQASGTACSA